MKHNWLQKYEEIFSEPKFQIFFLLFFSAMLFMNKLDFGGLANFDDCFYAQKAKEILETGDWITMHYYGNPVFENPPFYIWLMAIMFKFFGVSSYNARFFSALFGVGTIILVYLLGKTLFDKWVGFFSASVLITTQYFTKFARHAMFDVTLTFFSTLAILSFILGLKERKYFLLMGLAIGVSVLTKSVLGLFPLVAIIVYIIFTKQWKIIANSTFIVGILISISLPGFWYVVEYIKYKKVFLYTHFGWLIWERAFVLDREKQRWYSHLKYLRQLVIYYLPWYPLAIIGAVKMVKNMKNNKKETLLIIFWVVILVGTMSIANARKLWYIMPAFSGMAIFSGYLLNYLFKKDEIRLIVVKSILFIFLIAVFVVTITPVNLNQNRHPEVIKIARIVKEIVPAGEKVLNYNFDFWSINNVFLFYSDRTLTNPVNNIDVLIQRLNKEKLVCLIKKEYYDTFFKKEERNYPVITASGNYVLFSHWSRGAPGYIK